MPELQLYDFRLHYEVKGSGEPVVFIHGLGSSTRDWELQVDEFARDYQVVMFDVRGHGQSDKPKGPYSIPLFASDTAELIKSLNIAPVHVVGISMGGMIGLQLVVDSPDLVKSLVAVNCGSEMIIKSMNDQFQVWKRLLIPRIFGMRKMGEVLSELLFPKEDQSDLREMFVERWAENDSRAYRDAFKALVGWSVTDRLGEITLPVLVISADEDYTPVESKAAYLKNIKHGELAVIEDSRHPTPIDQPEEFNRVVRSFLGKQVG